VGTLDKNIRQEIATVDKDPFFPIYGGVLRHQDDTLITRGGSKGLKIYDDLLRDPHAYSVVQKRKMALVGCDWDIIPSEKGGREAKKAAELVKNQLKSLNFNQITFGLLDATLKGFSVGEVIWDLDGSEIRAKNIKLKDQRRFTFALPESSEVEEDYELRLLTPTDMYRGESLPPRKFIVHTFGTSDGNRFGLGVGTRLFWPALFKRQGITFWLTFVDKFASPTAIGKYSLNASPEDQRKLLEALGAIAHDSGVIIPEGMVVELLEASRSSSIDCYERLARFMDEQMSEAILGETLTTNVGSVGSLAAGQVHNDVRLELIRADADLLSDTLNKTLVRWIVELNMPGAPLPTVWWDLAVSEDLNSRVSRDKTIFDMGYRPTMKYIQETYGGEWEDTQAQQERPTISDQQFLANSGVKDSQSTKNSPDSGTSFGEGENDSDIIDRYTNQALESTGSEIFDSLKKLVDQAGSLNEVKSLSYSAIDSTGFGRILEKAMVASELAGRWEVLNEDELGQSFTEVPSKAKDFQFHEIGSKLGDLITELNFADLDYLDYEDIGRRLVSSFTEYSQIPIRDSEDLLDLKKLLESNYRDGITSIPKAFIDQKGSISGIFEDRINANLTKRYDFEISSNEISYKLQNPDEVSNTDFSEVDLIEFSTGSKQKNCTRGTKCGGSCISASKACRKSMDPGQRKLHEALLRRIGTVETSLAKKRQEAKAARGGGLSEVTTKRKERLAQAQEAKTAFELAQSKADLANKYFGKSISSHDAQILGVPPGKNLNLTDVEKFRKERDTAKAKLESFGSGVKKIEKFKPGTPLSKTQIEKKLSPQELDRLGDFAVLPDPRAYVKGSEFHSKAVELNQAYKAAKEQAPDLSIAEFRVARSYTKGSYYKDDKGGVHGYILPNSAARGLMEDPNSELAKDGVTQARLIHSALGKLPNWQGTTRRDTQLPKTQFERDYQVGKKIQLNGVTSTTADLTGSATQAYGNKGSQGAGKMAKESSKASKYDSIAQELGIKTIPTGDSIQVEYQISVRSGKDISSLSAAPKEAEIALRHGWQGTIKSIEYLNDGKVRVHLDED